MSWLALLACEPELPSADPPDRAEEAPAAHVPGPGELQFGVCVQCHGAHGEGRPELGAPRIGRLDAAYVEAQLRAFRDGARGSGPAGDPSLAMAAVAEGLPDAVIATLGPYVAALDPAPQPPGPPAPGAAYRRCAACHGVDAAGDAALQAPALAQQDPAYLVRQLRRHRDGLRGGTGGAVMAAQVAGLSDEDLDEIVAHIASLRPEPPPVEQPAVSRSREEGLAAFADIHAVATHPRCLNCHPDGDAPLQGDDSRPHLYGITRFSPLDGTHCVSCHAASPVGDGRAPLPPADPIWSMPPRAMAFQGRSPAQLCAQLLDPAVNGGRGLSGLARHVEADHLLITSWHSGREPPPITHDELVERFVAWGEAGGPCPER